MKKLMYIVGMVVIALVVVGVGKDLAIKMSAEKGVELVTGLKLNIGTFRVGIFNGLVDIRNMRLQNPAGYQDRTMLSMPEIYVTYDLPAILGGKIHLPEARIALEEFIVVKNANGALNLDALKVVQAQKEGKSPQEKAGGKIPEIQIDHLVLKIGKVVFKDYSAGGAPRTMEFKVNLNEEYRNIDNPYALVSLIVVKALMNTTIASLTSFDLGGLKNTVSDTLAGAERIATETAAKAVTAARQVSGTVAKETQAVAKQGAQVAGEAVKETTNALSSVFKNPFGKK